MLINSSQDLLYIVLALSILWFTIFLCWLLYQAARILKNANDIVESVTEKLELISEAVHFIRDKVDTMSSHMGVVGRLASGFVEKFVIGKLSDKLGVTLEKDERRSKKTVKQEEKKKR